MIHHNPIHRPVQLVTLLLPPLLLAACASTESVSPSVELSTPSPTEEIAQANMNHQLALRTSYGHAIDPPAAEATDTAALNADAENSAAASTGSEADAGESASAPASSPSVASVEQAWQPQVEPQAQTVEEADDGQPSAASDATPRRLVIRFGFDSSELIDTDLALVREHAEYLKAHPHLSLIVSGHTDSSGDPSYNRVLSERRAQRVVDALIAEGVPRAQLRVEGLADTQPLAQVQHPREQRRVELRYQESFLVDSR